MAMTDKMFKFSNGEWDQLLELRDVLRDCDVFTKTIQGVQITLSDFYAQWIQLKLSLQSKQSSTFAVKLIECMDKRGNDLLADPLVLSALFLDMRYRVLLNAKPIQKQLAMNHLALLWKRVHDLQLKSADENTTNSNEEATDTECTFDAYLDSLESNTGTSDTNTEGVMFKLQQFNVDYEKRKRESASRHAMDFWYENKHQMPELYELARLVFAVCPTETSVERNFSGLSYILNRYRTNLGDERLENILFLRLNKELFETVCKKLQ